jgi:hypothetical protein
MDEQWFDDLAKRYYATTEPLYIFLLEDGCWEMSNKPPDFLYEGEVKVIKCYYKPPPHPRKINLELLGIVAEHIGNTSREDR